MPDKELMLKGELYNPNNKELVSDRLKCKCLCHEFNQTSPSDILRRKEIIKKLLNTNGDFLIESFFWCDYGYNITLGSNFYSNHNLTILDPAQVVFGNNVFIGPNCSFYTALHPLNPKERNLGYEYAKPIKVGSNVWLGGNVTVLAGVEIGDNTTIGAGSVVIKSIPSNSLAYGNPCKVIIKIEVL